MASGSGERPHLLVLASTYPRWVGDTEPGFVHELCRRLVPEFRVTVLTPHAPGARRRETVDGVDVHRYRYAPERFEGLVHGGGMATNLRRRPILWAFVPAFVLAQVLTAHRLIRRQRPDVVHAHWLIPQGFAVALVTRLLRRSPPVVITSHGGDLFTFRGSLGRWAKQLALRTATCVTVVSAPMRRHVEALGFAGDIEVAPMGVDLQAMFAPGARGIRTAGELLFVGRLVEKKGLRQLVDAMPIVQARHPEARLVVVGTGPELQICRDRAEQLGVAESLVFEGGVRQADLPAYYRRAAVFVAPFIEAASGDQEGLGLVAVEAMGCECPTVVGRVAASADLECLANGQLLRVDANDAAALADAICSVLDDPRTAAHRAAAARRAIAARLDWQRVSRTYASLLGRHVRGPKREAL